MSAQLQAPSDAVVLIEHLPGHVARLTLNRPSARNAINGEVANALEAALQALEADDSIRAVVLTGAGQEAFCSGADLKEVAAGRGKQLRTERGGFAGFVYAPRRKPWIAAVNGPALAGGSEIALACDVIVAAAHAGWRKRVPARHAAVARTWPFAKVIRRSRAAIRRTRIDRVCPVLRFCTVSGGHRGIRLLC